MSTDVNFIMAGIQWKVFRHEKKQQNMKRKINQNWTETEQTSMLQFSEKAIQKLITTVFYTFSRLCINKKDMLNKKLVNIKTLMQS